MKRSERIYNYIKEKSAEYKKAELKGAVGLDAQEIAGALDILRNNVSKELNELHRQGRIVKFMGRPVRYFDKESLEAALEQRRRAVDFRLAGVPQNGRCSPGLCGCTGGQHAAGVWYRVFVFRPF